MVFLRLPKSKSRRIFALLALLACLGAIGFGAWHLAKPWLFPPDPLVVTPRLAIEAAQGRSLYVNAAARAWLLTLRPALLSPEDRLDDSQRTRSFAQATQNPKLFRQLDRQYRFDTVLLVGDPSSYQRLLDHFLEPELEKREFHLVYLDHWALIFQRNAPRDWQPADVELIRQRLVGSRSADRAVFLATAAGKLLAVGQIDVARKWLDEAHTLDRDSVDVLAGLAAYEIALGQWSKAEAYADRALEKDPNFVPALAANVVAMRATHHKMDAFKYSERLNKLIPEDPVRLWQHAEVAREAGQTAAEIKALSRLVALAKQEGRPSGEYEFFLGEAHARAAIDDAEHARLALRHLLDAVGDPMLTPEKRKFAEERIVLIRHRTGLR